MAFPPEKLNSFCIESESWEMNNESTVLRACESMLVVLA